MNNDYNKGINELTIYEAGFLFIVDNLRTNNTNDQI